MTVKYERGIALGIALSVALAGAPLRAEDASGDEVIITGTHLKDRTVLDSPVPVDVLGAEDLRKSGAPAGELGQALQALAPSFNFPRQSNSGGADHVRAAQLRGMSPDQVLVLVNGKRRHTSAIVNLESKIGKGTSPVDFNSIPLNAIKRIEILRDGAGAQYGSDAIAGVINIILDDSAEGGEAVVSLGENRTSFKPTQQTLTDGRTWIAQLKHGFQLGANGSATVGAEYRDHGSTNRSGFDSAVLYEFFDQTPANLATQGKRNYAPGDGEARDIGLWFNLHTALDRGLLFRAFGTYGQRDSVGAAFFRYPDSTSNITAIYPQGFRPDTLGNNQDLSVSAALAGQAGSWSWETSATFGSNDFDFDLRHSLNAALGPASPTSFHLGKYGFDQLTFNADATRELALPGWDKPVTLAVGAEARREQFRTRAGDPYSYTLASTTYTDLGFDPGAQAGPGLTPADQVSTRRRIAAVYVDLAARPTAALLLDGAARVEYYGAYGKKATGKLSGRYELTPAFALRAAASNSFRAPALSQMSFKSTTTTFGTGGALAQVLTLPATDPVAAALGARPLQPETSVNVSAGVTYAPVSAFNVTLDLFQITVHDRITLSEQINGTALTDFLAANGITGVDGINFFTNAVDTRTKGLDLVTNYTTALAGGALKLTLGYTNARTEIIKVNDSSAQLQALGISGVIIGVEERNTLEGAAPRTKAILSANWSSPRWDLTGRVTRYGSAERVFNFGGGFEPSQVYSAKTQLDVEAEFKPTKQLGLALGANNLLDTYPDQSSSDINYAGNLPYDVLSPIGFNGAFYYARVRVGF